MKKKRKHQTVKNKRIKRFKIDENDNLSITKFERLSIIITIVLAILFIILKALDNRVVGYDYFPSIPIEWIEWLK